MGYSRFVSVCVFSFLLKIYSPVKFVCEFFGLLFVIQFDDDSKIQPWNFSSLNCMMILFLSIYSYCIVPRKKEKGSSFITSRSSRA